MKKAAVVLVVLVGVFLTGCKDHNLEPHPDEVIAWKAGGPIGDNGRSIAVDNNGNVYVVGTFGHTATFGTTTLTAIGQTDLFIAKYNSNGDVQWVKQTGGEGIVLGNSIAVDKSGNIYITGYIQGAATIGTTPLTSDGSAAIFTAKFNTNGEFQWAHKLEGDDTGEGNSIAVDESGNVYITGAFIGEITYTSTLFFVIRSFGGSDIFIAKYNSKGVIQWVRRGGGDTSDRGRGIAIDAAGNVYVTGYFTGRSYFSQRILTSIGEFDMFISKYSSDGIEQWVQQAGGTSRVEGKSIAADRDGNVYITGFFRNTANFGATTLNANSLDDVFVAKYNSSGEAQWAQKAGGTDNEQGVGIAVDERGGVYVAGYFYGAATFGPTTLTTSGLLDIFITKYTGGGVFQWAQKAGGVGADEAQSIAVDKNGYVFITGNFYNTATFGTTELTANGTGDMFVAKFKN